MRVGFVSTRFHGTDGVTLEAAKWAEVLEEMGHSCFWFSGLSDRPKSHSMVVPEAFFGHSLAREIDEQIWDRDELTAETISQIERMRDQLRIELRSFREQFTIDLIISQNALTIPMQVPLGLALTELLEEENVPAIAHHHDFSWERERFSGAGIQSLLAKAFPPVLPGIQHVVINSQAAREVKRRKGIDATVIPNVMDFSEAPPPPTIPSSQLRPILGFTDEDRIFLQPTRIVPRKGIEYAIDLLAARSDPRDKLLISHEAGDEGYEYLSFLREKARRSSVDLRCIDDIRDARTRALPLWDLYHLADFVTYPSLYEGFGNALLETFSFRKPVLVQRYPVFCEDIEPHRFQVVTMDREITGDILSQVERLLTDEAFRLDCTETNHSLAKQHFGYSLLHQKLQSILIHSSSPG